MSTLKQRAKQFSKQFGRRVQRILTVALILGLTVAQVPSAAFAQGAGPDMGDGRIQNASLQFGVWWVEDYPPAGPGGSDLPATRPDALGLRDKLVSTCKFSFLGACLSNWSRGPWGAKFVYGNGNAWASDWRRSQNGGSENFYIDTIDLAYFAGHGSSNGIIFGANSPTPRTVTKNDALNAWGDRDLDWIGLAACNVLDNPISNLQGWGQAMNGVRLVMGFQTVMNDVPHGVEFGRYLRDGYTMTQAWFKAADKLQSQGRVARVLAEQQSYFNDTQLNHQSFTFVNWPKYYLTHPVGSEPAGMVSPAQVGNQMPVLSVIPLTLDQSEQRLDNLAEAFGVDVTQPGPEGEVQAQAIRSILQEGGVVYSEDGQLEMDGSTGQFLHADKDALWVLEDEAQTESGQAMLAISQDDAAQVATRFLTSINLLPSDAQLFHVLGTALSQLNNPAQVAETGEAEVVHLKNLNHQVIYSRKISYEVRSNVFGAQTGEPVEFSVMGPGSKLKVYVATEVPVAEGLSIASILQDPGQAVQGGMGGYRQVGDLSQASADEIRTVDVLPLAVIEKLFNNTVLEPIVSLDYVPFEPSQVVSRQILSPTLAYWEGPIGFNQGELIPVWALTVRTTLEDVEDPVESTTYIPVDPTYMSPLAYIDADTNLTQAVAPGATIEFTARDASLTLAELGLDETPNTNPLDFALGSGAGSLYTYSWFTMNESGEEVALGQGRTLSFDVPMFGDFKAGTQSGQHRIILEVLDTENPHDTKTSRAEVVVPVIQPTYVPQLSTIEP